MDQKRCVHDIQAVSSAKVSFFSSFYPSQIRPYMRKSVYTIHTLQEKVSPGGVL